MKSFCESCTNFCNKLSDLPQLLFRLVLAYGFFEPGITKLMHFPDIVEWFTTLHYPLPWVSAFLAVAFENAGFVLLFLGLWTRLISLPLIFIMFVAITTVHWAQGFDAASNGIEVPLYFLLMLFSLMVGGPGKISLDYWLCKKCEAKKSTK